MSTLDSQDSPTIRAHAHYKLALIETAQGEKYLRRLCKHFSHRVPARWDGSQGKVGFAMGDCLMSASDSTLLIRCVAGNDADAEEVAETIKSHFDRFAQKDGLVLAWQQEKSPQSERVWRSSNES